LADGTEGRTSKATPETARGIAIHSVSDKPKKFL